MIVSFLEKLTTLYNKNKIMSNALTDNELTSKVIGLIVKIHSIGYHIFIN